MFYNIYYFADSPINYFFLSLIMSQLFPVKNNWRKLVFLIISTATFTVVYYCPLFLKIMDLPLDYNYTFLAALLCSVIWTGICLTGTILSKFGYLIFYYSFLRCMKCIFAPFYAYHGIIDEKVYVTVDFLIVFITYILLFRITRIFKKYPIVGAKISIDTKNQWILLCPVCVFLILAVLTPDIHLSQKVVVSISSFCLLVILFASYFMISRLINDYEKSIQLNNALMETKSQVARYRYSILMEEQIRKDRHEIKNLYFYMLALIKEKKYEKMEEYLQEHLDELEPPADTINTGNTMIDYMLNSKIAEAGKYKIKTCTDVLIPANINVDENTLCTIFLNLFNNAIEASKNEIEPDIHITMKCVQNYLHFQIANKTNPKLLEHNPSLETTKIDKANHGLGMKIVSEAVEKSNGIIQRKMNGSYFTVTVMLSLQQK